MSFRQHPQLNCLHIIDMSSRGVSNIPRDILEGIDGGDHATDWPRPTSICDVPVHPVVTLVRSGEHWLLEVDRLTDYVSPSNR